MAKDILFITSNEHKLRIAQAVCRQYEITMNMHRSEGDEIQHQDPAEVTKAKARVAFENIGQPLVVQDTSWSIPALGGFPGPYMKDVAQWLSIEDWRYLMNRHEDKTILCHEHVVYRDGKQLRHFATTYPGYFIEEPRGTAWDDLRQLVVLGGSRHTMAEVVDNGGHAHGEKGKDIWHSFAKWYSQKK